MVRGEMFLYDWDDIPVRFSIYQDSNHRKRIFASWRNQIGYKVNRMFIHIFPHCDLNRIGKKGENVKGPFKIYREVPQDPIKRFPAKYDNKKSLYDD